MTRGSPKSKEAKAPKINPALFDLQSMRPLAIDPKQLFSATHSQSTLLIGRGPDPKPQLNPRSRAHGAVTDHGAADARMTPEAVRLPPKAE
jgi:hypothetical protein